MPDVGFDYLNRRIDRARTILAEDLINRQPLIFDDRIPDVPADEDEALAKFTGKVYAADLILDGQEAVVYEAGNMQFVGNTLTNLKIGSYVDQYLLNQLSRLSAGTVLPDDEGLLGARVNRLTAALIRGVRMRKNAVKAAMVTDSLTYDRFGVKLTGASWGMPASHKLTVGTVWSNVAATPIADTLTFLRNIYDATGETFNRMTLSKAQLYNIFATTEYQNKYRGLFQFDFPAGSIDTLSLEDNRAIVARMLKLDVETHDTTYRVRNADGTETTARVVPDNKVILWNTADDGNPEAWDFANVPTTESLVASIPGMPGMPPGLGGRQRGPLAYVTPQNPQLNPPGVVGWGVARGWPRKHRETASAVMTVG